MASFSRAENGVIVDNTDVDDNSVLHMHENTIAMLNLFGGDTVIVMSKRKRKTLLNCYSDASCEEGKVRVHGDARKKLVVKHGDVVGIYRCDFPYGAKVSVLPFSDSIEGITDNLYEVWLKPYFENRYRPVTVDDTFIVRGNMRAIEFKVTAIEHLDSFITRAPYPWNPHCYPHCIVSPETLIFCEGKPVERHAEHDMDSIGADNALALPVFICGATGMYSAAINGFFEPTQDGRALYTKRGDCSVCIEHFGGVWAVKTMEDLYAWKELCQVEVMQNRDFVFASVAGGRALEACTSHVWTEYDGASWSAATGVKIVTGAEAERQVRGSCRRACQHEPPFPPHSGNFNYFV
jgi:hypothetical protein